MPYPQKTIAELHEAVAVEYLELASETAIGRFRDKLLQKAADRLEAARKVARSTVIVMEAA